MVQLLRFTSNKQGKTATGCYWLLRKEGVRVRGASKFYQTIIPTQVFVGFQTKTHNISVQIDS